jgi:ATP-dependent DNA helicase RecG
VGTDEMTLRELLGQQEGKTLDFKRDLSSKKGVLKDLVAFANTSGGTEVIGVDDDRSVRGLDDPLKDEEKLANIISESISPTLIPDIEIATVEDKHVLVVRVARGAGPFYIKADGEERGVYVRVGSTNRQADAAAIAELKRSLLSMSYDQEASPVDRESLDESRLDATLKPHGISTTNAKLETLGVLVTHQGTQLASNGGVVMFGKDEVRQRFFPDARVRAAVFAGETKAADMLDQLDLYEATIVEAVDEVTRFISRNTRTAGRVKGMRRKDTPEYSEAMLREILINALAHADYSLVGMQIKVAIFSNRMEIENPGFLPFGMTIEHLKAGQSKIRNRVIARVFNEIDFLDGWGRAWERIQEAMSEGYPEPTFLEQGAAFKVTLWPHPVFSDMEQAISDNVGEGVGERMSSANRQLAILHRIDERGGIRVPDVVKALGVTSRTVERDMAKLVEQGKIEFVGAPKSGRYQRVKAK